MNDLRPDIPALDLAALPTVAGAALDVLAVEMELAELPHLEGDDQVVTDATDRQILDARRVTAAAECIGGLLPGADQAIHAVISGRFALADLIPAVLELAKPATIAELRITTLGFSKPNIAMLCQLLDGGSIDRLTLVCSHYFKATSGAIHEYATEELSRRPHCRFLSIRNHAKLLLMRLTDGRMLTVESSANLRSCKNIETLTVIGSPAVHQFHARWIDELVAKAERTEHARP